MSTHGFKALVAVLALLALPTPAAHATFPGGNGKIVFVEAGNLYTIHPDGTGQTQVTATGDAEFPAWSPDGSKIAFGRSIGGDTDIWVVDEDGSALTQLTTDPLSDTWPAWSPDGSRIAFTRFHDPAQSCGPCDWEIYTMKADGTDEVRLTNDPSGDVSPDWAPDGSRIAFERWISIGDRRLYTMKPDGSDQQQLIPGSPSFNQRQPSWHPEGYKLAFRGNGGIWSVNADGSDAHSIWPPGVLLEPVWSPNGGRIAGQWQQCVRNDCGPFRVFVMNPDGMDITDIATGISPDWQRTPQPAYVKPKGATPFTTHFDVAYHPCTAPNRTHGGPLAFPSCSPPLQTSLNVTVGTPDANGAAADFNGRASLGVIVGNSSTAADEADVKVNVSLTDIRCFESTIACTGGDLSDYTGSMRLVLPVRLTDAYVRELPATSEGTVSVPVPCTATTESTAGSTCNVTTTVDSVIPGAVREGNRAVWELGQVEVWDGGQDGLLSTRDDDTLFAVQGIFTP